MEEQKKKARENANFSMKSGADAMQAFAELDDSVVTEFTGYDVLKDESSIVAIAKDGSLVESINEGDEATLVTLKTPFYATMGGQKGDFGVISSVNGSFEVYETVKISGNRVGHIGKVISGTFNNNDEVTLTVDSNNRIATCMNHSATHLLQKALQTVLGDDVKQQGSYQDSERTRFDFSYGSALRADEIKKVEDIVNEKIAQNMKVETQIMSIDEARKTGAMALFGEKYGDTVRVVKMGEFSMELCGGTHVKCTGDIRNFKIISEGGVAAGVRRIEAITGSNVIKYFNSIEETLNEAAKIAKSTPANLTEKIQHMLSEIKLLNSELESLKAKAAKESVGDVLSQVKEVGGVKLLAIKVDNVDMNGLRDLGDQLKEKIGEGVIVIASAQGDKVNLIAMATDSAMSKGAHAGNLIKGIASLVGGGGGGRPNMAQAGGKNPAGIDACLSEAEKVLASQL